MHSLFTLSAGLSFAIVAAAAPSWESWCSPPPTVFITSSTTETQYVSLTSTTTNFYTDTTTLPPITIYQTITLTETSTTVTTTPTTATVTTPTTQTVTTPTTEIVTTPITETVTTPVTETVTTPITQTVTTPITETVTTPVTETITTPTTETVTTPITETVTTPITETVTTPITDTVTTPTTATVTTPTTATATEIISLYQVTEQGTSITLCPTRIANPTYTALGPYPTDWTWGCPPGWLCKPLQENCNFEAGIPDRNFLCSPNECIPAEVLPAVLQTWDADIYGNSTPLTNPALRYNAVDNFFNMNPEQFGLSYDIFEFEQVFTLTTTIFEPPSPTVAARQAQTSVPGACYPWCNNCLLEAQSNGKTPALCVPGSAYEVSLAQCEQCISVHKSDDSTSFVEIAPQFQQFLDYCAQFSTTVVTTSVTATTTNGAGSTISVVSPTTSPTVSLTGTTISSATPSSSPSQPTSVSTATVSTATITPSTPPAPVTTQPYTTTATVVTTTYSYATVSGPAWSQITIIMPVGDNSTTTIYGSTLSSESATLVLPTSPTTTSYTTTMTVTPGAQVSAGSTITSAGASSGSSTTGAPTSTFTGAATALRLSTGEYSVFRSTLFGLALPFLGMLLL